MLANWLRTSRIRPMLQQPSIAATEIHTARYGHSVVRVAPSELDRSRRIRRICRQFTGLASPAARHFQTRLRSGQG